MPEATVRYAGLSQLEFLRFTLLGLHRSYLFTVLSIVSRTSCKDRQFLEIMHCKLVAPREK